MSLTGDINWVKGHVILLAIVAGLTFGGIYSIESIIAKHDAQQAVAYKALADAQAEQNKAFQNQIQSEVKALADQNAALEAQNATLINALQARQRAEESLPKQNTNLTTAEAANKIAELTQGEAHPQGSDVVVDTPTAQKIVTGFEVMELLKQDKADLQKQNDNFVQEIKNDEVRFELEQKAHASDNSANDAKLKASDAALTSCKADLRKSKLKWFGIGVIVGYIGRIITVK